MMWFQAMLIYQVMWWSVDFIHKRLYPLQMI